MHSPAATWLDNAGGSVFAKVCIGIGSNKVSSSGVRPLLTALAMFFTIQGCSRRALAEGLFRCFLVRAVLQMQSTSTSVGAEMEQLATLIATGATKVVRVAKRT
jgi:hypothetical protein